MFKYSLLYHLGKELNAISFCSDIPHAKKFKIFKYYSPIIS